MPRIVIEFEGGSEPTLTGEIDAGAVLGDFCDEHEAAVPFSCKSASCGTCRVVILEGEDLLDAPEDEELEVLETPVDEQAGDTIFAIDRVSEAVLVHHFEELAREWPLVLVAEGLGASGRMTLPHGATPELVVLEIGRAHV